MKKNFFLWFFLLIFLTTYNYHSEKKPVPGFFSIKEIEIEGIKNSNKEELQTRLEKIIKKNIIFLGQKDLKEVARNIDFINSLEVKKLYPNKLKIKVIEDLPIGIYLNDNGQKHLILENNKIIKNHNYEFKDLPNVYGEGALEKFYNFYLSLKKTGLNLKIIKGIKYNIVVSTQPIRL